MRYYDKGIKIGDFIIWGISESGGKCYLRVSTVISNKEYIGCMAGKDITDALINLFSCKKRVVSVETFLKKSA